MNFKELLSTTTWEEVSFSLKKMYYNPSKVKNNWSDELQRRYETDEEINYYISATINTYKETFEKLKTIEPIEIDKYGNKWKIFVTFVDDEEVIDEDNHFVYDENGKFKMQKTDEVWWNVFGTNGKKYKDDHINDPEHEKNLTDEEKAFYEKEVSWAIEFSPWNVWLGMEVNEENIEKIGKNEFITACMWEMTFIDFDENEIGNKLNEIEEDIKDIKEALKNGEVEKFTDFDEFFKDLKK